jgi:hypothetical protein
VRLQAAGLLFGLISAANAAGVQSKSPLPQLFSPPTVYGAPTPTPQAPPTGAAPAPTPPNGLSPLLTQPGLLFGPPERASPSRPPTPAPAPVDQQNMQSYRNDLIIQRFQLDRQSVNPGTERYREIQRQLNQPGLR